MSSRLIVAACGLLLGGCASMPVPPRSLSVETSAASLTERSLRDPALHRFLADNLGRDPGETWDFESLAWSAFYFHPSLGVARAQWTTAQAVERTAAQRPNPTLTLTPGYNFAHEAGISPWMPAINLDFLLPTSNKRQLQQAIARSDTEAVRLAVVSAAWQVRADLRRGLLDHSVATARAGALHRQAEVQRSLLKLLEERYAAGSVAVTEVSLVRMALLRAEAAAADAQGQEILARTRAAVALGLTSRALEGVHLPSAPVATTPAEEARTAALHARSDILAALAKYNSAQLALELEVAKRVPDFHLGPGYQWDQGANKWTLALAFELPLFHRNEAPIAEATARREEAAAQFTLVQSQVIAAIDTAVAQQEAARLQRTNAQKLRAELQAQQARVRQRVDLGGADQVELQTAQNDLIAAELALVDADNAAAAASGQLEDALQVPFPHFAAVVPTPPVPSRHE
jgi:cobalt-zinc-cadmium efflux system outer membrane protein